ncbi:MAG: O-antigen ligase family protein [Bacteroidota bacterium]
MQDSILYDKRIQGISFGILFLSIALFAYLGSFVYLLPAGILLFAIVVIFDWKLAYWILLFSIPFSVEFALREDGTLSTTVPDEPMMWIFLVLFGLMWARNPNILPKAWWKNPLVLIVVLQYIWTTVAVLYSKEQVISLKFLAAKSWFLVSFFVLPALIFREKRDFKKAFVIFLIPLLTTMIIINIRHAQRQFLFYKVAHAIGKLYYNHVDYSTVISMFFPALCMVFAFVKGKRGLRFFLFILILFFLFAIYFTFARAAMIAVIFAAFMGIALRYRVIKWVMPAFYAVMIVFIAYISTDRHYIKYRPKYDHTFMHKDFVDHIVATFKGQDMSSMERVYRWIAGARMSMDEPIKGYGPNTFYYYYKPYAIAEFKTYVSANTEHSTAHNYFLFMLVEQGWPALILYAILVAAFFVHSQKTYNRFRGKDKFYTYCTIAVTMMFSAGFINNFFSDLIETHKVGGMFYLCLAMMVVLDMKSRQLQAEGVVDNDVMIPTKQ